jgi:hypothetical protein
MKNNNSKIEAIFFYGGINQDGDQYWFLFVTATFECFIEVSLKNFFLKNSKWRPNLIWRFNILNINFYLLQFWPPF